MMYALVHLLTSVATLRYSITAFFTIARLESHPSCTVDALQNCVSHHKSATVCS